MKEWKQWKVQQKLSISHKGMETGKSKAGTIHLQLRSRNIEIYSRNFFSPFKEYKQGKVQQKLSISN